MSRWRVPPTGRVEAVVPATPEQVYAVVADVTRIGEWSHECHTATWLDGTGTPVVGSRFRGVNRNGRFGWSRVCTITELEPGRAFGYRTDGGVPPDSTAWRLELEPHPDGTRVVQRFEILRFSRWMELVIVLLVPPHRDRSEALHADLVRLGEVASAAS
jgi:uncharacterized protein YndB with AHSA1/START domain